MLNLISKYIFVSLAFYLFISCSDNTSEPLQEIELEQSCDSPKDITISNITGSSVELSWSKKDNNNSFEIEYGEKGFTIGTGIKTSSSTNSIQVTDLAISSDYQAYVKAKCSSNSSEYSEVLNFSTPCDLGLYQGNMDFTTQKEVEDFGKLCYTGIQGWLHIDGSESDNPITDLSSLIGLTEITGPLEIVLNSELTKLDGLDGLTSVYDIAIFSNPNLVSIEGLGNIEKITGSREPIYSNSGPGVRVFYNPKLESLEGLKKITEVGHVEIVENNSLRLLEGFENLEIVLEGIIIRNNPLLEDINSLENLKTVGTILKISDNDQLTSLTGLDNLTSVRDELSIFDNDNLLSISGIKNLTQTIKIWIGGNESLNSLEGLNIEAASELISIKGNNSLITLQGIVGESSQSYLIIDDNSSLESLLGMETVTKLDGLDVFRNNQLNSLNGIDNLISITRDIRFAANPLLTDYCAITSLVNDGAISGSFITQDNDFNPSLENIQDGNCNQ